MSNEYEQFTAPEDLRRRIRRSTLQIWIPIGLAVVLGAGGLGWYWARSQEPTFSASITVQLTDDASGNSLHRVDPREVEAQRRLITSTGFRSLVQERLGAAGDALESISASAVPQATLITVRVLATAPEAALDGASELVSIFRERRLADQLAEFEAELAQLRLRIDEQQAIVDEITADLNATPSGSEARALEITQQTAVDRLLSLRDRAQEIETEIALADGRVSTVDEVSRATEHRRSELLTAIQGGGLALIVVLLVAAAASARNTRVQLVDEIEDLLPGVPVIASVPRFRKEFREPSTALVVGSRSAMREGEAFRFARTAIELAASGPEPVTIAITSATPSEGKSVCALNIAASLASSGKHTLLVDGDLVSPSVAELVGHPGLQSTLPDLLRGAGTIEDLITPHPSLEGPLDVLLGPASALQDSQRQELVPDDLRRTYKELAGRYEFVIIDCSPALVVSDAVAMAASADHTILVARIGQVRRRQLKRATATLARSGASVLGVVATYTRTSRDGYGDHGYYATGGSQ